jgi:hypothetical protein
MEKQFNKEEWMNYIRDKYNLSEKNLNFAYKRIEDGLNTPKEMENLIQLSEFMTIVHVDNI